MLRYCLNYAVSEELISANPMNKIKNEEKPHKHRTEREYLTIDELRKLAQTPFYNGLLKKAFLFQLFLRVEAFRYHSAYVGRHRNGG